MDCKDYDMYRGDGFIRNVILSRDSYLCCLTYKKQRNRTNHRTVPIMLGSYLDYQIRGAEEVLKSQLFWGCFVLKGVLRVYPNFSTFDSLSCHVRQVKSKKTEENIDGELVKRNDKLTSVDWFTYILASKYQKQKQIMIDEYQQQRQQQQQRSTYGERMQTNDNNDENGSNSINSVDNMRSEEDGNEDYGEGIALHYNGRRVTWTYKHVKYDSETSSDNWVNLLKASAPFPLNSLVSDYVRFFNALLRAPYDMNNICYRQILNGAKIIKKRIDYDENQRKIKKSTNSKKMVDDFNQGTLFPALSRKNFRTDIFDKTQSGYEGKDSNFSSNAINNDSQQSNMQYSQSYDQMLHEGRSNKALFFLTNVKRASNNAIRNSDALEYPQDGVYFYCLLNTKDIRSAGEQNVLADFVVMSEETDSQQLYSFLTTSKDFLAKDPSQLQPNTLPSIQKMFILNIDGYLLDGYCSWSFQKLLILKRNFPHVTTKRYEDYIMISTRDSIPIKYCQKYNCFFSAAETSHYANIQYPAVDMLSSIAKTLGMASLNKTMPAQATVSVNNIKGCVANLQNDMHRLLMENNLGVTCYMDSKITFEEMIAHAVLDGGATSEEGRNIHKYWAQYVEKAYHCHEQLAELHIHIDETDLGNALNRGLSQLYARHWSSSKDSEDDVPIGSIRIDREISCSPYASVEVDHASYEEYEKTIIYNTETAQLPVTWNIQLRAAFGNPLMHCVEDGIVLDRGSAEILPEITYNACITIEFRFKTNKMPQQTHFVAIDERVENAKSLIGVLISPVLAFVKNSRHCLVKPIQIGNHYYHLIHFLPKLTNMYENISVNSIINDKTLTVVIKGRTVTKITTGTKLANNFGHKNVCSQLMDLRGINGYTRDGRRVHAQIVYGESSTLTRMSAGQYFNMITDPEVAFTKDGGIIAPIKLCVHVLNNYANNKISKLRCDTLTKTNGLESQCLSEIALNLRQQKVSASAKRVINLHGIVLKKYIPKISSSSIKPPLPPQDDLSVKIKNLIIDEVTRHEDDDDDNTEGDNDDDDDENEEEEEEDEDNEDSESSISDTSSHTTMVKLKSRGSRKRKVV